MVVTSQSAAFTGFRWRMHSAAESTAIAAKNQKTALVMSLASRIGRIPQGRYGVGLRREPLQIVHEPIPRVLRVLVVHAHVNRFLGTNLLAISTEDAPELVDLVDQRIPVALLVLAWHQLDAVGGADLGTEPARHTLGAPL